VSSGQAFAVGFTLQEVSGAAVTLAEIAVAILNPDGTHRFDLLPLWSNVTIPANSTWAGQRSATLFASTPAGQYRAVLRGRVAGGSWFDFETTGGGVNPRTFTVTSTTTSSAPGTFTLLSATPDCVGTTPRIRLVWTASANAQAYDVYRNGTLYFSDISGTTFSNEGSNVVSGTAYSYFVRARNSSGVRDSGILIAAAPSCGVSAPPGLTLTQPNGGETWTAGTSQAVSWVGTGDTSSFNYQLVAFSTDGGVSFSNISSALPPGTRSFQWTVPANTVTTQARLRVRAMNASGVIQAQDQSDANFSIGSGSTQAQPFSGRVVKDLNRNGQHDAGEPYLQTPGASCSTPGEDLAGLLVRWTGPSSGQAGVNRCNPSPYFTSGELSSGTYAIQLVVPWGWVSTGPNPRVVTLPNSAGQDPWFFVAPNNATPEIRSVSPNPVVGSSSPQTIDIIGGNFVNRPSVFVSWSGGARTLDVSQVEFVSSVLLRITITTQTQADQWTVRVTNPDGRSSLAYPFSVLSSATPTLLVDGRTSSARTHGQVFQFSGAGFTPNGSVSRRVRLPNGTEQHLASITAAPNGTLEWTFAPACGSDAPGTYVITAIDQATGRTAPPVQQIVQSGGTCLADIVVSALTLSASSVVPGESVTVSYTVRNTGGAPASTSRMALAFAASTALPAGAETLASVVIPSLAAGGTESGSATITVPVGSTAGSYDVWATADADGVVAQTDRSNDRRNASLVVRPAEGCHLTCSAAAPSHGRPGALLTWQSVVTESSCTSRASVSWTFGDGTTATAVSSAYHSYQTPQSYTWTMTATAEGATCQDTGVVTITAVANSTLKGAVRNPGGTPVSAASIRVRSGEVTIATASSDTQGAWQVLDLAPGSYVVEASKTGHVTTEKPVSVGTGGLVDAGVLLLAATQSAVRITNVRTQYPGKVYLIPGISAPLKYAADIDWGGRQPGKVEFVAGGQVYQASVNGTRATRTLDLAQVASPCQVVSVVATSADGTRSLAYEAPGLVTRGLPSVLSGLDLTPVSLGGHLVFSPGKLFKPRLISFPVITIPASVPLIGEKGFSLGRADPFLRTEISSAGSGSITGGGKFDLKLAGAEASVEISAFARGTVDSRTCGWSWTAGIGLGGEFGVRAKPVPFFIPGVPIPLSWSWRLDVSGDGDLVWHLTDPATFGGGRAHVAGELTGGVVAGVRGVMWAEGTVGGRFDVDWRPGADVRPVVDFKAVGAVVVGTFLGSARWPIESRSFRLYPQPSSNALMESLGMNPSQVIEFVPLSRQYLSSPRRAEQLERIPRLIAPAEGTVVSVFEVAVFPFSAPDVSRRDAAANLVHLRDNPSRPDNDRTEVVLSQWNGQAWTEPTAVSVDATADFSPQVQTFLDGSALVVWEDFKTTMSSDSTLAEMWSGLEVSAAFFDAATGAMRPQARLTNNSVIDRAPRVAGVSRDNAMMTWLSTASTFDESNPLGILGSAASPTTLWGARWDGTDWSTPEPLGTFDRPVLDYDLSYDGTAARAIVSVDTDADLETAADRELFVVAGVFGQWQPALQLTDDETADEAPQVVEDSGENLLLWVRGDALVAAPGIAVEQRRIAASPGGGGHLLDFRAAVAPDGRLGLFWLGIGEAETDIFGVYYDPVFGVWGEPVKMSTGEGTRERNLAAVFLSATTLQVIHNSTPESDLAFDGSAGLTDFVVLDKTLGVDVGLPNDPVTLGEVVADGSRAVVVQLTNVGELAVQNIAVALYDGDPSNGGTLISTQTYADPLAPSGSVDVTFSWTPQADRQSGDLHVVVDPDDYLGDRNRANNTAATAVGRADLSIEGRPVEYLSPTRLQLTARVSNTGAALSGATDVRFRSGTADGELVQTIAVPALGVGESADVSFTWNTEAVSPMPGVIAVVVNETAAFVESATANNVASIQLECTFDPAVDALSVAAGRRDHTVAVTAGDGCVWTAETSTSWLSIVSGGGTGTGTVVVRAESNAGPTPRSGEVLVAGRVLTITQAANRMVVSPGTLNFAVAAGAGGTPVISQDQIVTIGFDGAGVDWTLSASQPWLRADMMASNAAGQISISVVDPGTGALPAGATVGANLTVTAPSLNGAAVVIPVTVSRLATTAAPQGQVDSPAEGVSGLQGAIAMTGWAVDDVGIEHVRIYRACLSFDAPGACQNVVGTSLVFLGEASVVPGARPDVEALYPNLPAANTAGWGLLILSNMLPNIPAANAAGGGVGTFTFYAVATDTDGHQIVLGRSIVDHTPTTVGVANNTIAKPFGAIDTPSPGATVSGTLNNFGWALTPDSGVGAMIPLDGTTIYAFVDGQPVGIATYNLCRGPVGNPVPPGLFCDDDVSSIFRNSGSFRNLDAGRGPIGLRSIDTTALVNGLHTISWGVSDTAGRIEGIGSRYFSVLNSAPASTPARPVAPPRASGESREWGIRTGFDLATPFVPIVWTNGEATVRVGQLDRLEVAVPGLRSATLLVNGEDRPLPVGLAVDPTTGRITWAPGPAYFGSYWIRVEDGEVGTTGEPVAKVLRVFIVPS
jgi:hypothetical protein